ncbi:hypothetical protein SUVZ_06G0260 [Saccharomyces uvarum]|uniref:Uncharacterized protein n=1 Tax=Saccharomyces uvarum TaxID=230603 RepID=A0ABN8WSC2_SACUV|nr:hypothetical protein SUVZ_06G0260 [Saccharomyces uvarum]
MRKQPTGVDSIVLMFHVEAAGSYYLLQATPCVEHWMPIALHILTNYRSHLGNRRDVIMRISRYFLIELDSTPVVPASFTLAVWC